MDNAPFIAYTISLFLAGMIAGGLVVFLWLP
jgi:hypothetical protein